MTVYLNCSFSPKTLINQVIKLQLDVWGFNVKFCLLNLLLVTPPGLLNLTHL